MRLAWRKRKGKDVWDLQIKNGRKLVFSVAYIYASEGVYYWFCLNSVTFGVDSNQIAPPFQSITEAKLDAFKWVSGCLNKRGISYAPIVAEEEMIGETDE